MTSNHAAAVRLGLRFDYSRLSGLQLLAVSFNFNIFYMGKQQFINCISAIQKQIEYDVSIAENLEKAFPDCYASNLLPNNQYLQQALLQVLKESMNDLHKESWIDYFIFELNFGRDSIGKVTNMDGSNVAMSNASELWDFLNSR